MDFENINHFQSKEVRNLLPDYDSSRITSPETIKSKREELSRSTTKAQTKVYAIARRAEIDDRDSGRSVMIHSRRILKNFNDMLEDDSQKGFELMSRNHDLLEGLENEASDTNDLIPEPLCTVCVPVAINEESLDDVARTISLIKKSQETMDGPVEVILWANATYNPAVESITTATETRAREQYDTLREQLRQYNNDGLRIMTGLQILPELPVIRIEEIDEPAISETAVSMSQIRNNYMDTVVMEAYQRGYAVEHPIIWLDADIQYMSKNTLADLVADVRSFKHYFSHANLRFSIDWTEGKPINELDSATKAVIATELQRRQRRNSPPEHPRYSEECGLAFALGTFLETGGCDEEHFINESAYLLNRAESIDQGSLLFSYLDYLGKINVPERQIAGEPLPLVRHGYEISHETHYIDSARVSTSARRHYELAKEKGVERLLDPDQSGYGEILFVNRNKIPPKDSHPISGQEMKDLLTKRQGRTPNESEVRLLRRKIDRYFDDPDKS